MTGRYAGELFVRVDGDRDAAPAYLPAAKTLMGMVLEQASFNNLGTHKLTRELRDGTVLVAEKIDGINRVTIAPPPPPGGKRPVRVFDDLLVIAGDGEFNGAGVRVRPPVILSHDDEMRWRAYFASSRAIGYYEGAGTYLDVFPDVEKNDKRLFGGNCFHRNKDGIVTSWNSAALFVAPQARNPGRVYSGAVFCLGMLLYTVPEVRGETSIYNRVLAAAIHDGRLLVLVAGLGALSYPVRPHAPAQEADAWMSKLYSDTDNPTALLRYKLKTKTDPISWHRYYETDYDSEEALWEGSLVRGYNRWTFDNDTGKFVSVQLPAQPVLLYKAGVLEEPLSSDEVIFRIGAGGLTTEPAGDVVYEEGGIQVRLEQVGGTDLDFVTPKRRIPAVRLAAAQVTYSGMVYADPVNDNYVLSNIQEDARLTATPVTGQYRTWLTALEKGVGTEFSSMSDAAHYVAMRHTLAKYLGHLSANGSGIAKVCSAVSGWVDYEDPVSGNYGIREVGQLSAAQTRYGIPGHSAGGYSAGSVSKEGGDWFWFNETIDAYFGRVPGTNDPTMDPVYEPVGYNVMLYSNVVSSEYSLAAHRQDPDYSDNTYLTGGNVDELTGGAFSVPYFSPLGKPHPEQPKERPA